MPARYTATRHGKAWSWDNTGGPTIRIHTTRDGRGGLSVEAWAQSAGVKIVVYAYAVGDVTADAEARESDQAPGHAKDPQEAGDGATPRVNPGGKAPRGDGGPRAGGPRDREAASERGSEPDERSVDDFERDLDIAPDGEDLEGETSADAASGRAPPGGQGSPGGDPDGRTGDDTHIGGTGPGGDQARADGQGQGSEGGGAGGSAGGDKDGQRGGAAGGMYGGEGTPGADGVPSGIGLFGGLIGIPAALKGLVELALIVADGDITGAGGDLFRQGLGKIAAAAAARRLIASEARRAAVKETKAAILEISAFEQAFGHSLPEDYRQFLLDVNGGQPDSPNCEFDQGVVNSLFSLDDTENDSSDLATRANRERAWLPSPDLLFIGHDDFGNSLLLALAGEHRGEVWFMLTGDDARPDDANPRVLWHDRRDMRKLAASFAHFMQSLRPLS